MSRMNFWLESSDEDDDSSSSSSFSPKTKRKQPVKKTPSVKSASETKSYSASVAPQAFVEDDAYVEFRDGSNINISIDLTQSTSVPTSPHMQKMLQLSIKTMKTLAILEGEIERVRSSQHKNDGIKRLHENSPDIAEDLNTIPFCIHSKTATSLNHHCEMIHKFFSLFSKQISKEDLWNNHLSGQDKPRRAFIDTFCADTTSQSQPKSSNHNSGNATSSSSGSTKHSIFWFHGSPGIGKTTWVRNFWESRLNIPVGIWNVFNCHSLTVDSIYESLSNFFSSACSSDITEGMSHRLVPVVIQNIDHVFDLFDNDSTRSHLMEAIMRLIFDYASSSHNCRVDRHCYTVVYITSTSKSSFVIRNMMRSMGLYSDSAESSSSNNRQSTRMIKFLPPTDDNKIKFLRQLASRDVHSRPSIVNLRCKSISKLLNKINKDHKESAEYLEQVACHPSLQEQSARHSIHAWLLSLDAQLMLQKSLVKSNTSRNQSTTPVVSLLDPKILFSSLLYPKYMCIDLEVFHKMFNASSILYGLKRLTYQLVANADATPVSKQAVSSELNYDSPSMLATPTLEQKIEFARIRRIAIEMLQAIQTRRTIMDRRLLDRNISSDFYTSIAFLLWVTSPTHPPSTTMKQKYIGWK